MKLSPYQHEQLFSALLAAFPTPEYLTRMMRHKLGENIHLFVYGDLQTWVYNILQWAEAQGRIKDLVIGARQSNPKNLLLFNVAQDLGLAIESPSEREIQRIIKDAHSFLDISKWREKLAIIENQVCRIEIQLDSHQWAFGTGFLIGKDILLTNYHVMKYLTEKSQRQANGKRWADPNDVVLRFDYKILVGQGYENPGTKYHLDPDDWLIDSSPMSPFDETPYTGTNIPSEDQLDYAVLHIDGNPGDESIGKPEPGGKKRGWIKFSDTVHNFSLDSALIIVQHPRAEPLKLALDTQAIIGLNVNETRVMYRTNTERGSSGSPCFNINWDLIALHHTGDPDYSQNHQPTYNQGIPVNAIYKLWEQRNIISDISN